jgi:transposase
LELHRPIDLLPERSASTLAAWLKHHPGIQIITRDRSSEYAKGATLGAPQARQIADRWHLLHNLIEAFDRALDRNYALLAQAAKTLDHVAAQIQPTPAKDPVPLATQSPVLIESSNLQQKEPTRRQRRQEERRARRLARFEQVKALQANGEALLSIAKQLHLARCTVRRYARTEQFPERAVRRGKDIVSHAVCRRGCNSSLWRSSRLFGFPIDFPQAAVL